MPDVSVPDAAQALLAAYEHRGALGVSPRRWEALRAALAAAPPDDEPAKPSIRERVQNLVLLEEAGAAVTEAREMVEAAMAAGSPPPTPDDHGVRLNHVGCGLCQQVGRVLTGRSRTHGTRVDQILSPDELAELAEDCRRPTRGEADRG